MFGIGVQELAIIFVVALLIFGPKRLPELARTLGKGLAEFRRASSDLRQSFDLSADDGPAMSKPQPKPEEPEGDAAKPDAAPVDPREQRDLDSRPQQVVGDFGHDEEAEAKPEPEVEVEVDAEKAAEPGTPR